MPVREGFEEGVLELSPLVTRDLGMKEILPLEGDSNPMRAQEGVVEELNGGAAGRRGEEEVAVGWDFVGRGMQALDPRQQLLVPRLAVRWIVKTMYDVLSIHGLGNTPMGRMGSGTIENMQSGWETMDLNM